MTDINREFDERPNAGLAERFEELFPDSTGRHLYPTQKELIFDLITAEKLASRKEVFGEVQEIIFKWSADGQSFTKGVLDDLTALLDEGNRV